MVFEDAPALPDWLGAEMPWNRRAARVEGTRIHFIDHGTGPSVLLMHGNPTWSFVWRKVIRALGDNVRVIAPDMPGFGLSGKPLRVRDHSLDQNIRLMGKLVDALALPEVTLVGQDWGGPVAAGVGARCETRIHGMVFANTSVIRPHRPFRPKAFHRFSHIPLLSDAAFRLGNFPVPWLNRVQGDKHSIDAVAMRAYAWPFRHVWDRAAPLALARMVPDSDTHDSTSTLDEMGAWVEGFTGPTTLVWGMRDPILGRALRRHREALPHAEVIETQAGHFLQEEVPEVLAEAIRGVVDGPGAGKS